MEPGSLQAQGVVVRFGGVEALSGLDLNLQAGEVLGLIGPNGAGKTTLVNVLSGFQTPTSGRVILNGRCINRWTVRRRARGGIARTFQAIRLFPALTVLENVELGALGVRLSPGQARADSMTLLGRVGLADKASQPAASLSYGEEGKLGILRALAMRPAFLLLDEPAAGLNEAETAELVVFLQEIRNELRGGVLIVEHNMPLVMGVCDRLQVLDYGRTIAMGMPREVWKDARVIDAYLGRVGGAR